MAIELTRDSVAMGDDVWAPHERRIEGATVGEVVEAILAARYLAGISGGKATWVVAAGGRPLAVVAQQWAAPKYVVPPETVWTWEHGHVHYHVQHDPDEVYAEMRAPDATPQHRHRHRP